MIFHMARCSAYLFVFTDEHRPVKQQSYVQCVNYPLSTNLVLNRPVHPNNSYAKISVVKIYWQTAAAYYIISLITKTS